MAIFLFLTFLNNTVIIIIALKLIKKNIVVEHLNNLSNQILGKSSQVDSLLGSPFLLVAMRYTSNKIYL